MAATMTASWARLDEVEPAEAAAEVMPSSKEPAAPDTPGTRARHHNPPVELSSSSAQNFFEEDEARPPERSGHDAGMCSGDVDAVIHLSDWLSCEVMGPFLRQFPHKHQVEAARCACRIGVHCMQEWWVNQKSWSLEDLLEIAAAINPGRPTNGQGLHPPTPRATEEKERRLQANQRRSRSNSEVVAQPWAAPRSELSQADGEFVVYTPESAAPAPTNAYSAWWAEAATAPAVSAAAGEVSLQTPPQLLRNPLRHGDPSAGDRQQDANTQRSSRAYTNGTRLPLRTERSLAATATHRRGSSQDSATPSSAAASSKDLHGIHPDGSASSLLSEAAPRRQVAVNRNSVASAAAVAAARRATAAGGPAVHKGVRRSVAQAAPNAPRGRTAAGPASVGTRRAPRSPASSAASRDGGSVSAASRDDRGSSPSSPGTPRRGSQLTPDYLRSRVAAALAPSKGAGRGAGAPPPRVACGKKHTSGGQAGVVRRSRRDQGEGT
eukprot:TRINITY_DN16487_c0_g1_i1.p1 TRINITY_DN16487_c0_g1~~TRINITY_DN16487_c0_g1_i1.p1  ORF type:complete len:494 (-),score=89.71 TRINITY_DN16487_c0_g1_i1:3-1484(-)